MMPKTRTLSVMILSAAALCPACERAGAPAEQPTPLTKTAPAESADQPQGIGVELIEILASGNPASRLQAPVTDRVVSAMGTRVSLVRIDVDSDEKLAAEFGAKSFPTFIVRVDGSEVRRLTGLQSEAELRAAVERGLR